LFLENAGASREFLFRDAPGPEDKSKAFPGTFREHYQRVSLNGGPSG
jgi:hypothetical protein